jgi:hypothetical protein
MKLMNTKTLAKATRWAGRIISVPVATFFMVFGIGYFFDSLSTEGWQSAIGNIYDFLGVVGTVLTLVGIIISWWWLLPAGILLIFAYFLGAISSGLGAVYHVGYFHWTQLRDFWGIPGIIYLITGVLFILSWWLSRKETDLSVSIK